MASEREQLRKYLEDVESIWDLKFSTQSKSYFTDANFNENFITPRDIKQITLNFNLKNDEFLVEYLRSIGCDLIYEDMEYRIIKDSFQNKEPEIPVVKVDTLTVVEAMELAYYMLMRERVESKNAPVDIIELSYELKNQLKFPDEFFNEFPSLPISTPTKNSQGSLVNYGRVQGLKIYYNYFYINKDVVIPSASYPAQIQLDSNISLKGLTDALIKAFDTFSKSSDFQEYLNYRMLKNIRNKYIAKKGKPVNLSLWSDREIKYATKIGLFVKTENTLTLKEDKTNEDLNEKIDELRLACTPTIKKWKNLALFS